MLKPKSFVHVLSMFFLIPLAISIFFLAINPYFELIKPSPSTYRHRIYNFIRNGSEILAWQDSTTIKTALGEPLYKRIQNISNIHRMALNDQILELFYNGAYIVIYKISEGKEYLIDLAINDSHYKMKYKIKIGDPQSKITRIFGDNYIRMQDRTGQPVISYNTGAGPTDSVYFYFDNGCLRRVLWDFYID